MKKLLLVVSLIAAALAAVPLAGAATIYNLPADFSGVQGQDGWHYGAVPHGNYWGSWEANWTDYPNYYDYAGEKFWWRIQESGIWKRVYSNVLWSNHTDGPGVYWEVAAGNSYSEVTVLAQVTGAWATYLNYWDASTATNTILDVGKDNTLYNVEAGDKIAFIMNAGDGTTRANGYNLTITIIPEPTALSLLLLGGLALARRRR